MKFRNASKAEPCKICSKPDWCTILEAGDETLNVCRRVHHESAVSSPVDGRTYEFVKTLSDGSSLYEDFEIRQAAKRRWLEENNKTIYIKSTHPAVQNQEHEIPAKKLNIRPDAELDAIYRSFLKKLRLYQPHTKLLQKDGWTKELLYNSEIKSVPVNQSKSRFDLSRQAIISELIREFGDLSGVPGFYKDTKYKSWSFYSPSGILFPQYNHRGHLFGLKIRLDNPGVDDNGKEKSRYRQFSYGNQFRNRISLYFDPQVDDFTICYITEGEKKGIVANHLLRAPVISIPGVNSFRKIIEQDSDGKSILDYLKDQGCKILIIAYDADKIINESVLYYESKLIDLLTMYDFNIAIADWNPGFGKGLDDILWLNVRPNYSMVLSKK